MMITLKHLSHLTNYIDLILLEFVLFEVNDQLQNLRNDIFYYFKAYFNIFVVPLFSNLKNQTMSKQRP